MSYNERKLSRRAHVIALMHVDILYKEWFHETYDKTTGICLDRYLRYI